MNCCDCGTSGAIEMDLILIRPGQGEEKVEQVLCHVCSKRYFRSLPKGTKVGFIFKFPPLDCNGVPIEKMPDCPNCGKDELGYLHESLVICYACNWRNEILLRIETECGVCKKRVTCIEDPDNPNKLSYKCEDCGHSMSLTRTKPTPK